MPITVAVIDRLALPSASDGNAANPGGARPAPVVQAVETLAQGLAALYEANVEVLLVDLESQAMEAYPEVAQRIAEGEHTPAVVIQGGPTLYGGFSMARIKLELERLGVPRRR